MAGIGTASFGRAAAADGELEEDDGRRSASSRMKQLRRGTIRIGQELDLHGFLRDEALKRLGHFIDSASVQGLPAVLVITGKGHNSPDGPVLQGAVAAWLRQARSRVAEFHPAPRDKGGSGAFVVFLKKN
jgi:DNA-nicking Smr family endonuclease